MRTPLRIAAFLILQTVLIAAPAAESLDVRIGYIQWKPDPGPVLSNILPEPEDAGLRGAELGIEDNNTTGRFLKQTYHLDAVMAESPDAARAELKRMRDAGIELLVLNVPADLLRELTDAAGPDTLVFNAGAPDNHLRTTDCQAQLLHTAPSRAMLTDALAQWLAKRQWREIFLITGSTEGDKAWAESFRRSVKRFGVKIVEDKPWTFDGDLRRTASSELPRFTQGDDYDAVVVADERGDFGEYVPFNTWLPRPVVGTQGMMPVAWHRVVESWGAAQLQSRFEELADRPMNSDDYAAWAAVRSIGEAVIRTSQVDHVTLRDYIFSDNFQLAGFKGRKLDYRRWNGQLRQPIPLVHPRALVSQSPQDGFLHPTTELDTLGFDAAESQCRING
ncbi:ABC transporter substrate-binding protein [Marinobacter nanhaiticus D15-8W]|uniref:Branched-chain amino acid ABC transporter substrate-binding protein n=1 Tax=Marinobacter nanhaiticus D15-8W TaxID=626887 RepID=N6X4N9_9GAMM|nr:ABC transporter substrate-binding protein [Marinobacter nanhaiticus]ENO16043.1 branched-chain amino acid ABC transporter substrate-binding protein [Marinobacter nanhaiticus D15-8W]BES73099.1 ABC transporter substrate-binding protein [Marinobacter nanhaiticus D15-8W]